MSNESKIVDSNGRPLVAEECSTGCCNSCSGCEDEDCAVGECSQEELPDSAEEDQKMLERQYIKNPFEDSFMPIALIESAGKTYIGGVAELYESSCILTHPVLFREMLSQEGALQVGMQTPYMVLGCIDSIQRKYDSIYILRNSRPQDMRLADEYEKNYTQTRLGESGIVQPTQEDMIQLARG